MPRPKRTPAKPAPEPVDQSIGDLSGLSDKEKESMREKAKRHLDEAIDEQNMTKAKIATMVLAQLRKGDDEKAGVKLLMDEELVDAISLMARSEFAIPSQLEKHGESLRRR